jgi:hypothetical protein
MAWGILDRVGTVHFRTCCHPCYCAAATAWCANDVARQSAMESVSKTLSEVDGWNLRKQSIQAAMESRDLLKVSPAQLYRLTARV